MENIIPSKIEEIEKINLRIKSFFEKKNIFKELEIINKKMLDANFWQDKSESKKILKEKNYLKNLRIHIKILKQTF